MLKLPATTRWCIPKKLPIALGACCILVAMLSIAYIGLSKPLRSKSAAYGHQAPEQFVSIIGPALGDNLLLIESGGDAVGVQYGGHWKFRIGDTAEEAEAMSPSVAWDEMSNSIVGSNKCSGVQISTEARFSSANNSRVEYIRIGLSFVDSAASKNVDLFSKVKDSLDKISNGNTRKATLIPSNRNRPSPSRATALLQRQGYVVAYELKAVSDSESDSVYIYIIANSYVGSLGGFDLGLIAKPVDN